MKICFLVKDITNLGGVQRVLSVLASELVKENKVDILCVDCPDISRLDRKMYNLSYDVNVVDKKDLNSKSLIQKSILKLAKDFNMKTGFFNKESKEKILEKIYYPKNVQKKFIEYLNSQDYDIVIGVEGLLALLLGMISNKLNCKTIGWQHNAYEAYLNTVGKYHYNQNVLFKECIPKLDEYIVLSNHDKEMYKKDMNVRTRVIYNPRSFVSDEHSSLKNKKFLSAGRFHYQKGFDLLIESFSEFAKKDDEWTLTIVGEGEDKDKIKDLIDKYKLNDRVKLDPFTDNIKSYFMDSSILLLPSRWEGMPMIVLESLSMGVPIISYDITAVEASITNNYNGIIVEKYDTHKFSEAMLKLSSSPDKIKEMGANALKKSEEFDIEIIAKEWNDMFNNLVKK